MKRAGRGRLTGKPIPDIRNQLGCIPAHINDILVEILDSLSDPDPQHDERAESHRKTENAQPRRHADGERVAGEFDEAGGSGGEALGEGEE